MHRKKDRAFVFAVVGDFQDYIDKNSLLQQIWICQHDASNLMRYKRLHQMTDQWGFVCRQEYVHTCFFLRLN